MPDADPSLLMLAAMNPLTESTFARIIKALGRDKALRCGQAALSHLGIRQLVTAQDLLGFSNYLIQQGGVVEAVGRALKVSALLRGATDRASGGRT